MLGRPPDRRDPAAQAWEQAARAITNYRTRYRIADYELGLGSEPPAGAFQHRLERRQTAAEIREALDQLARPLEPDNPLELQIRQALRNESDGMARGHGWER